MKIVGKLHDYYDGLRAFGADDSLIFNRTTAEITSQKDEVFVDAESLTSIDIFRRGYYMDRYRFPGTELTAKDNTRHRVDSFMIGFCGSLFFGLRVNVVDRNYFSTPKFIYTVEDAEKLDEKYQYRKEFDHSFFNDNKRNNFLPTVMKKYAPAVAAVDTTNFCIKHKVPYFYIETLRGAVSRIELIPELKKFDFQKVKDPYTAFQDISMFLGGVIPRQAPEVVEISDKDRIVQHGFNELSFRNPIKFKKEK